MGDQAAEYLTCLAKLREEPLNPEALFALAALYAEEGHRTHAVWYLRKVEFLDASHPGLARLKERLRNWNGNNGGLLKAQYAPRSSEK